METRIIYAANPALLFPQVHSQGRRLFLGRCSMSKMTLEDQLQFFAHQAYVTRLAQINYFRSRSSEDLGLAKHEEAKLDAMIARVRVGGPVKPDTQSSFLEPD